jgi:hypothetical protein
MHTRKIRNRLVLPVLAVVTLGGGLALSGCGTPTARYEVTGTGPVTVDYSTVSESGGHTYHEVRPAPFTKELPMPGGQYQGATMVVSQTGSSIGSLSCKLTIDGKLVDQKSSPSSSGGYANIVVCAQIPHP